MSEIIQLTPIHNFSYSRCASDEQCQRKRYLGHEWGGTGLQPIHAGWALVHGNISHKYLEQLAKTGSIDYTALVNEVKTEAKASGMDATNCLDWAALTEGQLRGFQLSVWPLLMAEYDIIGPEKWVEIIINGYKFRARQDLLLKSKFDGHICYVDYKNTSTTSPQWIKSWAKSVQLHSSMYALRLSEGISCDRALVIGLYKGYNDKKKDIQRSVFTYGYVNREYAMSPQYSYNYTKAKGWEMFSTGAEFDNLEEWVSKMPTETLAEQYPQTGPIPPRDDIAEEWFTQQLIREAEVDEAAQLLQTATTIEEINAILRKYYKQNFSHCTPSYGYDCEFLNMCWIPHIGADPLGSGQFKRYESVEVDAE